MDVHCNYFQIGSDLCESYLNVNSLVIPLYRVLGDKGEQSRILTIVIRFTSFTHTLQFQQLEFAELFYKKFICLFTKTLHLTRGVSAKRHLGHMPVVCSLLCITNLTLLVHVKIGPKQGINELKLVHPKMYPELVATDKIQKKRSCGQHLSLDKLSEDYPRVMV